MGCVLSAPVELVRVQRHGSAAFKCGVAEMQGWRSGHEDAHEIRCGDKNGAFWVLDGHGGDGVALAGAPKLGEEFDEALKKAIPSNSTIEDGMATVDAGLRKYVTENPSKDSGSTVVGAMVAQQKDGTYSLKLINCGDSRGIIVRGIKEEESSAAPVELVVPDHLTALLKDPSSVSKGDAAVQCSWPLIQESVDHKPSHPTEKARIEAAGGHVTEDDPPRLDGNLAVSRGLGDFEYKSGSDLPVGEQKVSCVPDIYEINGLQPGSILILCCDGVWDVMNGQEIGCLVRDTLRDDPDTDLGEIAQKIIKLSLEKDSRDNITAMIVHLVDGTEWEEHMPDEITGFEKLVDSSKAAMEEEVKNKYMAILRKWEFPSEPVFCDYCGKWKKTMMQCPCKKADYCSKHCQKRGWKKHKVVCPIATKK